MRRWWHTNKINVDTLYSLNIAEIKTCYFHIKLCRNSFFFLAQPFRQKKKTKISLLIRSFPIVPENLTHFNLKFIFTANKTVADLCRNHQLLLNMNWIGLAWTFPALALNSIPFECFLLIQLFGHNKYWIKFFECGICFGLKIVIEYYYVFDVYVCVQCTLRIAVFSGASPFFLSLCVCLKNLCKIQLQSDLSFPTCTINRLPNIELLPFLDKTTLCLCENDGKKT